MNKLQGVIVQIQKAGAIMLVDINVDGQIFSALLVESAGQSDWLIKNKAINIVFKETEVSLAKNLSGLISSENRMICKVLKVEEGVILSTIKLQFKAHLITSAITTRSADSLHIKDGDKIEALVNSNEISLLKINI